MRSRLSLLVALWLGCSDPTTTDDGGAAAIDARGSDAPTPAIDASGADVPATDAPGTTTDAGALDPMAELTALPSDTGGTHTPHPLGSTDADYGYYLYLPGGYDTTELGYPLVVFLHGRGERGNGTSDLARVLNGGVTRTIERDLFAPTYPMIVASPQYPPTDGMGNDNNWGEGDPSAIHDFIAHVVATYRVNPHRIYLTGLSHGGNGVYDYLILQDEPTSLIAAAAPIAAWGPNRRHENARSTPIWIFVGENDTSNFNTSRAFVTAYNALDPAPLHTALFTVYPDAGHDVWTRTYDLTGMGTEDPTYDPYDVELWDWFFTHRRE